MTRSILLVDDQHDILSLLHSALDTLGHTDLEILEAASAEAALEAASRQRVDLLVTDHNLPGMSGMELMHKVRAAQPDVRIILITANSDRKLREEMLNSGAAGVFSKPVPLGDFLDAAERSLGFERTLLPAKSEDEAAAGELRVSELLANFRQDTHSNAVLLINNRGLVAVRAGNLHDGSRELSLISALAASFSSGLKIAEANRQDAPGQFSVFSGGDHDLLFMPVDATYALLLAGKNLTNTENLPATLQALAALRVQVGRSLRSIGVIGPEPQKRKKAEQSAPPAPEMESLLDGAASDGVNQDELDAYWDSAAARHAGQPMSDDVIPFEEARRRGLTPDSE